jgi:hypothetical protein
LNGSEVVAARGMQLLIYSVMGMCQVGVVHAILPELIG